MRKREEERVVKMCSISNKCDSHQLQSDINEIKLLTNLFFIAEHKKMINHPEITASRKIGSDIIWIGIN